MVDELSATADFNG